MPAPRSVPSSAGPTVELASVTDERLETVLGKVDTVTVESGPDLLAYIEGELVNALSRLGFAARQVERAAPPAGRKRVLAALRSAELASESTLRFPVAAAVRVRIELIDESGSSTFRKEVRGSTTRDLGFHRQGGPEDAQLLAEAVDQAIASLAADASFAVALESSPAEAARRRASDGQADGDAQAPDGAEDEASVADRLLTLDRLRDEGLIDKNDYDRKRRGILDDL